MGLFGPSKAEREEREKNKAKYLRFSETVQARLRADLKKEQNILRLLKLPVNGNDRHAIRGTESEIRAIEAALRDEQQHYRELRKS
ncbi:hypothetical protein [Actinocatenispora sera]|uniref:Uncharacterized protein n=1 Tax=Actinocatenispora sera TaxID=390989 RepID=A0A810L154_9ACTN|nr:hypothetical protein [Actinocatenispora sera]BCJ27938.1 hypothetical protein Asera_20460 [Actinocatenispora sera]